MIIDDKTKEEILKSIALRGAVDDNKVVSNPVILGSRNNLSQILNLSSGLPKIRIDKKFSLILSQPLTLQTLSPFEIRCCLCKSVISYPCWYYSVKYAVNHFHYFVCFDRDSSDKPSTKCYRRG